MQTFNKIVKCKKQHLNILDFVRRVELYHSWSHLLRVCQHSCSPESGVRNATQRWSQSVLWT